MTIVILLCHVKSKSNTTIQLVASRFETQKDQKLDTLQ